MKPEVNDDFATKFYLLNCKKLLLKIPGKSDLNTFRAAANLLILAFEKH
jgi:hypothetical protein